MNEKKKGIIDQIAPPWRINDWIDEEGNALTIPLNVNDFKGNVLVIFCFQAWCPGSHTKGGFANFEQLKFLLREEKNVKFVAIQTVFEEWGVNTKEMLKETQERYKLKIPFGHDAGEPETLIAHFIKDYKTGGTPWVVVLDKESKVVYNDQHVNEDELAKMIKKMVKPKKFWIW